MLDSHLLAQHIFPIFHEDTDRRTLHKPKLQDLLWKGETEQARNLQPHSRKDDEWKPTICAEQIIKITEDPPRLQKLPKEHLIHLLKNYFGTISWSSNSIQPKTTIKFIDETLLNLEHEDYHEFGMKLFAQLPLPETNNTVKIYYCVLLVTNLRVRSGVTFAFDKIWNHDPQWGSKLLVNLIEEHMLKAKRIELSSLSNNTSKENEHHIIFMKKSWILAWHVAHLILNPQASNVELTKSDLHWAVGWSISFHLMFLAKKSLLLFILPSAKIQRFKRLDSHIKCNPRRYLPAQFERSTPWMVNPIKFTAGAPSFNFRTFGRESILTTGEYILWGKSTIPDFDQGLLPHRTPNPHSPNVDDQSKTAGMALHSTMVENPYLLQVDSNVLKLKELSGSTYINDTISRE